MSIEWVRKNYRVPAKIRGRVVYTGEGKDKPEYGTIIGTSSGHLKIRMDGQKHGLPYHPTWEIQYLGKDGKPL